MVCLDHRFLASKSNDQILTKSYIEKRGEVIGTVQKTDRGSGERRRELGITNVSEHRKMQSL